MKKNVSGFPERNWKLNFCKEYINFQKIAETGSCGTAKIKTYRQV